MVFIIFVLSINISIKSSLRKVTMSIPNNIGIEFPEIYLLKFNKYDIYHPIKKNRISVI